MPDGVFMVDGRAMTSVVRMRRVSLLDPQHADRPESGRLGEASWPACRGSGMGRGVRSRRLFNCFGVKLAPPAGVEDRRSSKAPRGGAVAGRGPRISGMKVEDPDTLGASMDFPH